MQSTFEFVGGLEWHQEMDKEEVKLRKKMGKESAVSKTKES